MSTCQYFLNDNLIATGMPEIKQWLFNGGLERLLPGENVPKLVGRVDSVVRYSKTAPQKTNSTVSQVKSWLPKQVTALMNAGKLKVVQSVNDLPEYLMGKAEFLAHTVWHGTPHDFDRFDISKIGTGEQAQAFGYGLYFTDAKSIAEHYRDNINKAVSFVNSPEFNSLSRTQQDLVFQALKSNIQEIRVYEVEKIKSYLGDSYDIVMNVAINKGKLYETELAPAQEEYLDWDKPLSKQSDKVLNALKIQLKDVHRYNEINKELDNLDKEGKLDSPEWDALIDESRALRSKNGFNKTGEDYYKGLGSDKAASDYLHSLGISGIRYKAEGGKSDANNYVIFSDEDISITAKYSRDLAGTEALYDPKTDTIYLVADMLTERNTPIILAHELTHRAENTDTGVRRALIRMESSIQTAFDNAAKGIGSANDLAAYQRVIEANTQSKDQLSEFIAYKVTEFLSNPKNTEATIANAIKGFISAIKVFLLRNGLEMGFIRSLNDSDFVAMSKYGARVAATQQMTGDVIALASKSGYEGNDKGEAFEWLRSVAKGLDMSKEARIARAKEMGFDVDRVWYHGRVINDIINNIIPAAKRGAGVGVYYLTSSKKVANAYAKTSTPKNSAANRKEAETISGYSPNVTELITNIRNPLTDKSSIFELFDIEDLISALSGNHSELEYAEFWDDDEKISAVDDVLSEYYSTPEYSAESMNDNLKKIFGFLEEFPSFYDELKNKYDGVIFSDLEAGGITAVPFFENSIRSINAAFDPDFAGSPNLLASITDTELESLVKQYASESGAPTRAEIAEALKQYRDIESQYFNADGTPKAGAMLAPNGKPTNLNKVQWIQVRTENFKNWFGDWETAYAKSKLNLKRPAWKKVSKVIDKNGEPLVLFHGSKVDDYKFTEFKQTGLGTWFTPDKRIAERHFGKETSDRVFSVFLNIRNPDIYEAETLDEQGKSIGFDSYSNYTDWKEIIAERNGYKGAIYKADDDIREANILSGQDGILIEKTFYDAVDERQDQWVAFFPNQIKSATGNIGSFSQASNDIRFSRTFEDEVTEQLPGETFAQYAQRRLQDKYNHFMIVQDEITINQAKQYGYTGNDIHAAKAYLKAGNIKPIVRTETDFHKAESTHSGIATEKMRDFNELIEKPLIKEMADTKIKMTDIGRYLLLNYALVKPELGIATADANSELANFQARPDFAKFKEIADKWLKQVDSAKSELRQAGIAVDNEMLPIDIPNQRTGEPNDKYAARLAQTLKEKDVVQAIIENYKKSMNAIELNKIHTIAANFIKEVGNPEIGVLNPKGTESEGKFTYYVNGEKKTAQFTHPFLARAISDSSHESMGAILDGAREINGFLSKVYTGYSPTFLIKNPIRDAVQGFITNTGNLGFKNAAEIMTNAYLPAMGELWKHLKNHGSSDIVNEFRKYGGSTGAAYMSDAERIGEDVMDSYNEYAGSVDTYNRTFEEMITKGRSQKYAHAVAAKRAFSAGIKQVPVIGHFISLMEKGNAVTENALRLATFNTLVKNGYSKEDAASYAKNLMNFNRKGELTTQASAIYLFFNPNLQGSQVLVSALKSSKHKNQARALTGVIAMAAFLAAEAMRGGDDDDEEKWKMLPENLKDRNLIFKVPGIDTPMMLPVPYGYGLFHSLGNAISDVMHGEDTNKASLRMLGALFDNFSPLGNPVHSEHGIYQMIPTLPKMALAPSINENSFGAPIQPEKWTKSKTDSSSEYRGTKGTVYEMLAQGANTLTGGDKYRAGFIDISPETLKFWTSSLTGGTGQFVADSFSLGNIAAQGADISVKDVPIVKAFAHEIGVQDARREFWNSLTEAKTATEQFAAAKKQRDRPAMAAMKEESGDLMALAKVGNRYQKMAAKVRDQIDNIRMDDSLSLSEKRDKQKRLEDREMAIYTKFLRIFDARMKKAKD